MQAIIISNIEAQDLMRRIKLKMFHIEKALPTMCEYEKTRPGVGLEQAAQSVLRDMHRRFHYEVTRWLQEMGATETFEA